METGGFDVTGVLLSNTARVLYDVDKKAAHVVTS